MWGRVLIRSSAGWSAFFVTMETPAGEDKSCHQLSETFSLGHSSWGGGGEGSETEWEDKFDEAHTHRGERKRERR